MLHVNLIVTAVLLILGAFIGLVLCFCVDVIPIIKSRGSTLVSRDTVTRDQARALKKSLRSKGAGGGGGGYLQPKPEVATTRQTSARSNVYERDLVRTGAAAAGVASTTPHIGNYSKGATFSSQTVAVVMEPTPELPCIHKIVENYSSHHQQRRQEVASLNPCGNGNEEEGEGVLVTTVTSDESCDERRAMLTASDRSETQLQLPQYIQTCSGRCTCAGSSLCAPTFLQPIRTTDQAPPKRRYHHQHKRFHRKVRSATGSAPRNTSPYSSVSSSSSSGSGSGRRARITRLEDIQEDVSVMDEVRKEVEEEEKLLPVTSLDSTSSFADSSEEALKYVDTKKSSTGTLDSTDT